ncbi:MAG: D-alanyl-D-alanine carboxypeptidase family protein [Candidatus Competibacteraceae bacterium]|jgi:D-alanyl-D-alanine carboxypeptidase|nr:D-alanyl-D-alanine carboxypeptidase family protein [Candidatus Competibacteraceae bacterium]
MSSLGFLCRCLVFVALAVTIIPCAWAERYAALVIDADSGRVLFERHARAPRHPASLTKMMTLYMVFDALERGELRLKQRLRVSKQAASRPPSKLGVKAGDTITVEQAIYALVTRSANDVAAVIGEAIAGSEARFAQRMTRRARGLGMTQTTFRNASGLPDKRQITTAWDMATLAKALIRNHGRYYRYFSTPQFYFRNKNHRNHNHLLKNYAGTDGIKTGYIRMSGFNLVASARRNGRRLIGVVFGGKTAKTRDAHMRTLLDNGFAQLRTTTYARSSQPQLRSRRSRQASTSSKVELIGQAQNSRPEPVGLNDNGFWQVQVGVFSQLTSARQQLSASLQAAPAVLFNAKAVVVPLWRGGTMLYKALFQGLSQENAGSACYALKVKRIDCFTVAPTG